MATGVRMIVFYISSESRRLAARIQERFAEAEAMAYSSGAVEAHWESAGAMVFIMASGIAVRSIAPLLRDKRSDPAVLVMDDGGGHVVSLAGGHAGGANALARELASFIGAEPVITTGTDTHGLSAIDLFAADHELAIENPEALTAVSSRHMEQGGLSVFNESALELPPDYKALDAPDGADVIISSKVYAQDALMLRPRNLVLGMGLNSGTGADEIASAVKRLFAEHGLSIHSLLMVATHEKKKREPGLMQYAREMGLELRGFTTGELNAVEGVTESRAAMKALGVRAVAEPSALLASGTGLSGTGPAGAGLMVDKVKDGNLTLAICVWRKSTLYVVGTGPGGMQYITPEVSRTLREADAVVGFKPYLKMVEPLIDGKEVHSSAMTQEVDRVNNAVDLALSGRRTVVVSGGDPGVYAMAGLVYEVVRNRKAPIEVKVLPGLSALNACGARLGAPLMHDFCAISLSDRLTPWELIEKRLHAAGEADFVIALYNPRSKGRRTQIERAREIVLEYRAGDTPVGIVTDAMRPDESVFVATLDNLLEHEINMKSTVIIGNSVSFRWHDRLVTPRGYGNKYEL